MNRREVLRLCAGVGMWATASAVAVWSLKHQPITVSANSAEARHVRVWLNGIDISHVCSYASEWLGRVRVLSIDPTSGYVTMPTRWLSGNVVVKLNQSHPQQTLEASKAERVAIWRALQAQGLV